MRRIAISILAVGLVGACSTPAEPSESYSIVVPNSRSFLELGDSLRFEAVRIDESGKVVGPIRAEWSSSRPSVLTFDRTGLATARALGLTEILASTPGGDLTWILEVVPHIARLVISPGSLTIPPGDRASFVAVPVDASGASLPIHVKGLITWSLSDPGVARSAGNASDGLITALAEGHASVEAELLGRTGHSSLTVKPLALADLSLGGGFSCALGVDSLPYCWGAGLELLEPGPGMGPWTEAHIPHRAGRITPLVSLTAGGRHACGLTRQGEALCWGSNEWGALGIGSAVQPIGPVRVSGNLRFVSLTAGGFHTCGIATTRQTFCWGLRHQAEGEASGDKCGLSGKWAIQLPCDPAPAAVAGLMTPLTSLSAGTRHTCGLDMTGRAWCWGLFAAREMPVPELVDGSVAFTQLASGLGYTCGLTTEGLALCWGSNTQGQLGDGTTISRERPTPVAGNLRFIALSAGQSSILGTSEGHVCGLTVDGTAYCWGRNSSGELGVPWGPVQSSPVIVPTSIRFSSVRAGEDHTCGRSRDNGVVYCWGSNQARQLGIPGPDTEVPVPVTGQRSDGL